MLAKRIIPCLDIKAGRVVKGTHFSHLIDAGDPVRLAELYNLQGADELVFLDITASQEKRKTLIELVSRISERISIPFTVGGGITGIADVDRLLQAGADKICINSTAMNNPLIIDEIAGKYGSQVCVVAIDAREEEGDWVCYQQGGSMRTDKNLFTWSKEAVERGAGEILFTSIDHDGSKQGFAINAIRQLAESLTVPVIASGGAGKMEDFEDVFTKGLADAALAASLFHYGEIQLKDLKRFLKNKNIIIRE